MLLATVLWSLAGLFARMLPHLDFGTILGWRAGFGGVFGLVFAYRDWRRGDLDLRRLWTPVAPLVIFFSATAISAYVAAVMATTIADVLVIYATLPFVAAAMAFIVMGERPDRRTMIAAGVAMVGIVIMVADGLGKGRLLGQALSFLMTATFAGLIVTQRRDAKLPVTPINSLAALVASVFGFSVSKHMAVSPYDLGILFLFGVSTITIAFALFMEGAKHVPSAEASLLAMLDVVLGPLWVLVAFAEHPDRATVIGGAIVLAAAIWRLAPELKRDSGAVTPTGTPL